MNVASASAVLSVHFSKRLHTYMLSLVQAKIQIVFLLLESEDLRLFFAINDKKWNIFELIKRGFWRRYLRLREIMMCIYHYFLSKQNFYHENSLQIKMIMKINHQLHT